jgi:hypothetical protein
MRSGAKPEKACYISHAVIADMLCVYLLNACTGGMLHAKAQISVGINLIKKFTFEQINPNNNERN